MAPGRIKLAGQPAEPPGGSRFIVVCRNCERLDDVLTLPRRCRNAGCPGRPRKVEAVLRCGEGCTWAPVRTKSWIHCTGTTRGEPHRIDVVRYRFL